ncbi:MAG: DNA polymerase I, partial [Lachnospiraceae bacterium]|nr:DNA polymerase I [Lachnospiraceae bacterium]
MKKLLLIDGYSIICRGYYALPMLSNSKAQHTNACLGFFNIFYKVIEEENPDYIAVAFDENAPTFRHELYKEYKGKRQPMPAELKEQVPYVKDILSSMNVSIVSKEGYEADDIMGTLSHKFSSKDLEAIILSGDRDMLQLATSHIKIRLVKTLNSKSTTLNYYEDDVYNELNVTPTEYIDVKALMGDQSDNIPGVTGVGEKTALSLIMQYKSIENIYTHIDEITKKKLHETLEKEHDDALFWKKMVTIVKDAPIDITLEDMSKFDIKSDNVKASFLSYEMNSIYKRLGGKITSEKNKMDKETNLLNLFNDNNA